MKLIKPLALVLICAMSFSLSANAGKNKPPKQPKPPKEGKKVPIDGGITLLVAAGAALGAKKVFNKSNKNTPDA